MRTLIRNRHGWPLLSRIFFTRALQKTWPCVASHHLSINAQMIGLLSINHSVKTKGKKTPGRRGEWTESSGYFYGRLRAAQGIRGLSYTGGSGANGLNTSQPITSVLANGACWLPFCDVAPTNITAKMVVQVHQPWSVESFQGCKSQIDVDLIISITVSWVYLLLYL